jgi:hypothetical protein
MLDFFGFGRRRKTRRHKSSKSSRKKIPKQLKAIAKRYRVSIGHKSVKTIKKQCRKKIMGLIKKAKVRRKAAPKRRRRRARFGAVPGYATVRKNPYISSAAAAALLGAGAVGYRYRRGIGRGFRGAGRGMYRGGAAVARGFRRAGGMIYRNPGRTVLTLGALGGASGAAYAGRRYMKARQKEKTDFGKRRRRRAPPAAAMFGRRRAGGRRRRMTVPRRRRRMFGFGNGGNPALSASMGYEFCPGGGGVLGANSTGLFPSPCMAAPPAAKFGKRRRRRY